MPVLAVTTTSLLSCDANKVVTIAAGRLSQYHTRASCDYVSSSRSYVEPQALVVLGFIRRPCTTLHDRSVSVRRQQACRRNKADHASSVSCDNVRYSTSGRSATFVRVVWRTAPILHAAHVPRARERLPFTRPARRVTVPLCQSFFDETNNNRNNE